MLHDAVRIGEFLIGDVDRKVCFDAGWADTTQILTSGLAVALRSTDGAVVPWDATSADAGTKKLVGVLYDPSYPDPNQPDKRVSYLARGPAPITTTCGRVQLAKGDAAMPAFLTAVAALGITVRD